MTVKAHTHFDVKEDAETLKNVACDSEATALASIVFPLPGGPKRSRPEKEEILPRMTLGKIKKKPNL